jgi:hypothetical protein
MGTSPPVNGYKNSVAGELTAIVPKNQKGEIHGIVTEPQPRSL